MSGVTSRNDTTGPADPREPHMGPTHTSLDNPAVSEDCPHDSKARGLDTYTCPECHARIEANLDEVLHIILVREDWIEDQLSQVTMQQFVQTPISAIKPDSTKSGLARQRGYQRMILIEGNARRDAARELKAQMDKEARL